MDWGEVAKDTAAGAAAGSVVPGWGNLIGGVVGLGTGIYNSIAGVAQSNLDRAQQNANVDKTIAANRQLAQMQFDQNKNMWAENNRYNSPEAQMARLKLAGLNPNLVYGSGGSTGNSSGSIPQYQAPRESYDYRAPDIRAPLPESIAQFQDFQLRQAQIDNTKTQTAATQVGIANAVLEGKFASESFQERMNQLTQRGWRNEADRALLIQRSEQLSKENPFRLTIAKNQADASSLLVQRSQAVIDKILQDIIWQTTENQWRKSGVTSKDSLPIRFLSKYLGGSANQLGEWFQGLLPASGSFNSKNKP